MSRKSGPQFQTNSVQIPVEILTGDSVDGRKHLAQQHVTAIGTVHLDTLLNKDETSGTQFRYNKTVTDLLNVGRVRSSLSTLMLHERRLVFMARSVTVL